MLDFVKRIFGTAQTRLLKKYAKIVEKVNEHEIELQSRTDEEVRHKTVEFRERLAAGEPLDDLLPEAFAVVKNTCRRLCGTEIHVSGYNQKWDMVPYDVQILGAIALYYGAIAEMQTGEGKTLTESMPLYLNALTGLPVHLVTVNDYLAERDCQWMGTVFRWLGLTVEAITNSTPPHMRKKIYESDIVYGTCSEFGFDYLRDNSMAQNAEEQSQRGHFYAIVDEVDSILVDEARTPLIISGPTSNSRQMYDELKDQVAHVVRLQRDACNKLVTEARRLLENIGWLTEGQKPSLSKEQENDKREAIKKIWMVGKGTPHNKLLKRLKEDPEIRAEHEKTDIYYHNDANKDEKTAALAELHIIVDEKANEYELTDKGIAAWTETHSADEKSDDFTMLDLGEEYATIDSNDTLDEKEKLQRKVAVREEDARRKERSHNVRQLFRGHLLMEKDVDYIVADGKIVIIDENTGRPQPGRRFSDGLHQALEAKEGVAIQGETQTYATITLQNYFRMYKKLAGMTGTAMTEANEFKEIYKLEVLAIPTHRPNQRRDTDDEIYMTEREKYNAILKDIQTIHGQGRPILIGTESVEVSEKLSRILRQNRLEHTILNAKNHAHEAAIIADAGKKGAITVATNMAGRGTDIKLQEGVAALGGLHVIGTTRHHSRRIDRQLRGRSARLGDPGSSKFYVSFEDALMRMFSSPRITAFLQRFRPPEGEPISAKVLNKSIETAQKRIEQRNYAVRKHTLEYDDVMNKQRTEIYSFRNDVLRSGNDLQLALEVIDNVVMRMTHKYLVSRSVEGGWNHEALRTWLMTHFPVSVDSSVFDNDYAQQDEVAQTAIDIVHSALEKKLEHQRETIRQLQNMMVQGITSQQFQPDSVLQEVIRSILIRCIDKAWQEHLLHIDHLRAEVSLQAIGQKDPLTEFKHAAFGLFDSFTLRLQTSICHSIFKFEMVLPPPPSPLNVLGEEGAKKRSSPPPLLSQSRVGG